MKDPAHNNYNNLIEFPQTLITDDELSLSALGLYLLLLCGDMDLDLEDTEYREAFKELYGKNYIDISLIQK